MAQLPDKGLEIVRQRLEQPVKTIQTAASMVPAVSKLYQPIIDAGKRVGMRAVGAFTEGHKGMALVVGEYHDSATSAQQFMTVVNDLMSGVQGATYVLEGPPGIYCIAPSIALDGALASFAQDPATLPVLESIVQKHRLSPLCIPVLVKEYAAGKRSVIIEDGGYDVVMWNAARPEVLLRDHWSSHKDRVRFADDPAAAETQRKITQDLATDTVRKEDVVYTAALAVYLTSFIKRDQIIAHAIASEAASAPVICKVGIGHVIAGVLCEQLPRYGVSYIALAPDVRDESLIIPSLR